jgi:hypothetical protein
VRLVNATPADKVVVSIFGGKFHPRIALAGADNLHFSGRQWSKAAVVHLKELPFEVAFPGLPKLLQNLRILRAILVAPPKVVLARPNSHLLVFRLLPT